MASPPRAALQVAAVAFLGVLLQVLTAETDVREKASSGLLGHMQMLRQLDFYELEYGNVASRSAQGDGGVKVHRFTQRLDHFNNADKRTWQQRYYSRSDQYAEGGPAFVFIGGEGTEKSSRLRKWYRGLFMSYLAEIHHANMFDLEHRFYGTSQPTEDLRVENLKYLSADQAIADLAHFIEHLTAKGDLKKGQKVVVFGVSYPGMLAAWARATYPHLIHAAVSSSAPVHAKADFSEYMDVVAKSTARKAGQWCNDNIKIAMDRIEELLKTREGRQSLKKTFGIQRGLETDLDVETFVWFLSIPFGTAVQYNRDDKPKSSTHNIAHLCSHLKAKQRPTPDQALRNVAKIILQWKLTDWTYASLVKEYQEQTRGNNDTSSVAWYYQTCTEFGFFHTYSGKSTPFPRNRNKLAFNIQLCKDIFGKAFDEARVNKAVLRTNSKFGDRHPNVTNVIFVNGDIDPWHALGILKDVNPKAKAVIVKGGSHGSDSYYPNATTDSDSLKAAHATIQRFVRDALLSPPQ